MNRAPSISPKLPPALARILDHIRRRHLAMSIAYFPIYVLPAIAIAWSLQGIADRVFNFSWGARCVLLGIDIAGVVWLVARFIVAPLLRQLDRKGAALLAERGIPEFRSSLISSVELASDPADVTPASRVLVAHLLAETTALARRSNVVARVLPLDRCRKLAVRMALPVIAAVALMIAGLPDSGLLLKRILLSRESFPARTTVVSITEALRVEEGADATLTARAKGVVPTTGKLVITRAGGAPEVIPVAPAGSGGNEFSQVVRNIREPFSYHFELNDGIGPNHEMAVDYPPVVDELRFTQIYPAYTGLPEAEMSATGLKLLEGSTLRIEGTASTKLSSGAVLINGAATPSPIRFIDAGKTAFRVELTVPATGWKSLSVHVVGADQHESVNEPEYPLQIERDRPPSINLTAPKDEMISVLMNSTVPITFEVADDYGFSSIVMSYQIFRPLPDGNIEEAESGNIPIKSPERARTWNGAFDWNLARLLPPVPVGGSIIFWIEVTDNNGGPAGQVAIRSPEKTIQIVSEEQKRIELLNRMAEKATEIERLYEQQRSINGKTESAIK